MELNFWIILEVGSENREIILVVKVVFFFICVVGSLFLFVMKRFFIFLRFFCNIFVLFIVKDFIGLVVIKISISFLK